MGVLRFGINGSLEPANKAAADQQLSENSPIKSRHSPLLMGECMRLCARRDLLVTFFLAVEEYGIALCQLQGPVGDYHGAIPADHDNHCLP